MAAAKEKVYYSTGRRKTAAARVFLREGTGKITINKRPVEVHLKRNTSQMIAFQSLEVVNQKDKFDMYITVKGGGESGQAGAIRHGIARALTLFDLELRPALKRAGHLRRDPRMVERKKYGRSGARKRFQYSKR